MSRHVGIRYAAIHGTGAGLGRTASARTLVADRPEGAAGGTGLGFNGGELLSAALGGCFWNDLHYVAEAAGTPVRVDAVESEIEIAGNPPRAVRARIKARLSGADEPTLAAVFEAACAVSTVANSILPAIPVAFERQSPGDTA